MRYRWATWGDLNAFFGLMLDNMTNLILLTAVLVGTFGFPAEFIFSHMFPGTALGVLVGDLIYGWLAFRLAARSGRDDVTAMPLGLDTPTTIGLAFAVLGPAYVASGDPVVTWQVGAATLVLIGLVKLVFSFSGEWLRAAVPQAGLLGPLAGVGLALLAFLPLVEIFQVPLVGLVALGIALYTLVAALPLPGRLPGAFAAVLAGTAVYFALGPLGLLGPAYHAPTLTWRLHLPLPTTAFLEGLPAALAYVSLAIPFGILNVVGGLNNTESARVAGDPYDTRSILLTEAVSTLVAGICGGVAQTTPYIGHPAYKAMGARAAYVIATGLFVGLGGMLGYVSFIVDAVPHAAVAPILIFIGLEIVVQAFQATPARHAAAVALACLPVLADLVLIQVGSVLGDLGRSPADLGPSAQATYQAVSVLAQGFILTALLWGGALALVIDRQLWRAAGWCLLLAVLTLFGVVHSAAPNGAVYWPWEMPSPLPWAIAASYVLAALGLGVAGWGKPLRVAGLRAEPAGR
ncbi:MAG TPA: MFS transporter [Chloroflexota bacterium]|nr:MFS transporter [Chloroflexota bacterium]